MTLKPALQFHLLLEGMRALSQLAEAVDHLYETRPPPTALGGGGEISANPEIPRLLVSICSAASSAQLLLFDKGKKRESESAAVYHSRVARVAKVDGYCAGVDIIELRNRAVRNRIEHIDEHLTKVLIGDPAAVFLTNIALSNRGLFVVGPGINLHCCRAYFSFEDVIEHLGAELHIGRLRQETGQVLAALQVARIAEGWPAPPGMQAG